MVKGKIEVENGYAGGVFKTHATTEGWGQKNTV